MAGGAFQSALHEVRDQSLVHLIKDDSGGWISITDQVDVKLVDIETLKGKTKENESPGGHDFNKSLGDQSHLFSTILVKASVNTTDAKALIGMDQDGWDDFLAGLDKIKSESVKDIPFARLAVRVEGNEIDSFDGRWFFKGEPIPILVDEKESISLELVNVYNTKDKTSGEPEAVNLRVRLNDSIPGK